MDISQRSNTPRSQEDRQTDTEPTLLPELVIPAGPHFCILGQGKKAGASVGPGKPDPVWGGSLYFGSWLPPFEEVILVQKPKERAKGWPGREGMEWAGVGKKGSKEGRILRSIQPETF